MNAVGVGMRCFGAVHLGEGMNRFLRVGKNLHRCAGRATVCRAAHNQSAATPLDFGRTSSY